jgi:hypothetical protein
MAAWRSNAACRRSSGMSSLGRPEYLPWRPERAQSGPFSVDGHEGAPAGRAGCGNLPRHDARNAKKGTATRNSWSNLTLIGRVHPRLE